MRSFSARRLAPTCIIAAATVAALVAPGAASAALGTQCSGANITAQGSSLQKDAQLNVWNPGFNSSTKAKSACSGTQGSKGKPTVTYTSSGSGAGMEAWGLNKHAANYAANAFVGTDEPPNAAQLAEIEANESTPLAESLETIPVVQESVAIMVHLPANCLATSKKNKGRLELTNVTLEGIYRGTITKWNQINADGDALSGAGCNAESPIVPIARRDQSGTTHIFKKYLSLISGSTFLTEAPKEQNKTWTEVSEGTENTTWPKAANVLKPAATGGGALITEVNNTAGSIGYANLAEVRLNKGFTPSPGTGGANTAKFWAPVQNNGLLTTKLKFTDPSSDGDSATLAEANCKGTEYTNGEVAFPPASVLEPWNEVTTRTTQKKYTICGLTYDLAFTGFSHYPGTSLEEATTVHDYLKFVVDSKGGGGQKLIVGHDYLALPKGNVLTEAQKGAEKIAF